MQIKDSGALGDAMHVIGETRTLSGWRNLTSNPDRFTWPLCDLGWLNKGIVTSIAVVIHPLY